MSTGEPLRTVLRVLSGILASGDAPEPDTPFERLGLGSLAAVRLLLEVSEQLGVDLPMDALRTAVTPRALAALATGTGRGGGVRPVVRPEPHRRYEPFELTPLQEAYVLGKTAATDGAGCHLYREFDVPDLDVDRLRAAWDVLVRHHDALRLTLTADHRQRVTAEPPPWDMPIGADSAATRERMASRVYRPGDSPLWSVAVTRNPDGSGVLHLSIDGLITDGAGLELLVGQLWTACRDPGYTPPQAEVGVRDLVTALAAHRSADGYRAGREYWVRRLGDLPPGPALPAVPPADDDRVAYTAVLTAREWAAATALAGDAGVSATALALTVFAEALRRGGAGQRFSLILTTNDRMWLPSAAAGVPGPFTSSVVFVAEDTSALPLTEAARTVHERLRADLDHADVPAVAALRELRAHRMAVPDALPVVFTSLLGIGGSGADGRYAVGQTSGVTLDAQLGEHDGELHVRWEVRRSAYPAGVIDGVFGWFVNTLRWLPRDGGGRRAPLNELQQAYFVARSTGGTGDWSGCQVCHGFRLPHLDRAALERAWLGMLADFAPLRTVVTHDGALVVHDEVPERWYVPVSPGWAQEDMVSRAYPLGRLPQAEIRVNDDADGGCTLHVAMDLLVADGRSIHLMMRELLRRYAGAGAAPVLAVPAGAPPAVPAERRQAARSYWRERLAGLPPGPPVAGTHGPRRRLAARVPGWAVVRDRAAQRGLAPDAVILAALTAALDTRFTEDYAVPLVRWTPGTEARRPAELTALSWVPRAAPGTPLVAAARGYHDLLAADAGADDAPGLTELRRQVLRRGGDGGYPVVVTGLLEFPGSALPPGVTAGPWLTCTPDVALDCIAVDDGAELAVFWDVGVHAFPPGLPEAVFDAYRAALAELGATPTTAWEEAPVAAIDAWNDTAVCYPHDGPVHRRFEEQARTRPGAVAVRWRGGTMTYRELNAAANRIAVRLRAAGVGKESVVAVSVDRGPLMVAAVYGVLKAGGAYLPVDPGLPAARAEMMLRDAGASATVTAGGRTAPLDGMAVVHADRLGHTEPPDPDPVTDEDATAYVIFTSGSTGRPKGVAVAHRAVHNLLHWAQRTFAFGPSDTGLCVTSLGFDLSVFDLLGLLSFGASVYVADADQQRDPALLLDVLLDEPVTFWNSAPTTLTHVAPLLAAHRGGPGTGDLRLVFLSGDYTPLTLPDEVRACFAGAEIVNLGGATEATVWSNYHRVGAVDPSWRSIPYGRPIDNARYYILDDRGEPCPPGVGGDLYIAGDVLSLGYLNRPELTAERFVPCPYGPGGLMYRTGDRASFAPDGLMTFLGRADHQVKIRGFRVELGEIEHRLRGHPGIRDAVVLAREEGGERKLVAYVLAAAGAAPGVRDLRGYAAEALPDYMVPNHVAFLDRFPATANGKLDRDALPWPLPAPAPAGATAADGRATVLEALSELLDEPVDPAADLWDQGATSFTMVQLSARLQERWGTRVPVAVLLDNPTVDGIAAHLTPAAAATPPPPPAPAAAATAPPAPAEVVDVLSATEKAAFAATRPDLRDDGPPVPLPGAAPDRRQHRWRASRRDLDGGPVTASALGALLALLRPVADGDRTRRLYPSAGDTYGVQVYVHVPGDRVTGLPPGVYYHHPDEHALRRLGDAAALGRSAHFVYNRPVYDRAAFGLYLVGQHRAIRPLYGDDAGRFLALEAGYLGQVLMTGQAATGLGLCPVGGVAADPLRAALRLDDDHEFLQAFLGGAAQHEAPSGAARPPYHAGDAEIAVVGVAGRYPEAGDLDTLWRHLSAGRCSITAPPAGRGPGPHGGWLADVESFDSMVFGIAPAEAATLDPQMRLLLQAVWGCLEDAGHTAASLGRVGVFVGVMWHDHRLTGTDRWRAGEPARVSGTGSEIANRVSHVFDFRGPSIAVDASCASSLAALHLAAEALRRGDCDAAVVGAANLLLHPYHASVLRELDLIAEVAPRAMDATAGGWAPGEGVGALLLRRLDDARRDRDGVHGVVEGTWSGHSGATGRFGTPDVAALSGSLTAALRAAGREPGDVGYVECAASGAALSDAAEVEAVARVFGRDVAVPVGTLKPNLGHAEAASGLAQLTKVLLMMRHRRLAPTLLATNGAALVDLGALPVRFVTEDEPWPGGPMRAMVTAVGATGSVGHVVLRAGEDDR